MKTSFVPQQFNRFDALTGLRAIAAIMVFLYHNRTAWFSWMPQPLISLLNEFHTGVSLFFVLSGFLIGYTYREQPALNRQAYTRYLLVRLARIFPVYLLLLSAKYIHLGFPGTAETIVNYTLAKGLFDDYSLSGLPQSWSLTTELCFYIAAPFIFLYAVRNVYKTGLVLLMLMGACIGLGLLLHAMNVRAAGLFYPPLFVFNNVFFARFVEFYCGLLLAMHLAGKKQLPFSPRWKYYTLVGSIASLLIIYCISLFQANNYKHGIETYPGIVIRNFILPVAIVVFIFGLIQERTWLSRFLSTKFMLLLGNASYVFYLIHINYVNNVLWGIKVFPDRNFVLLWLVAIVLYLLVEKPVYHFLRRQIKPR
jgi:peptidoglycan/LPS O-acetylase OafA/YrhL